MSQTIVNGAWGQIPVIRALFGVDAANFDLAKSRLIVTTHAAGLTSFARMDVGIGSRVVAKDARRVTALVQLLVVFSQNGRQIPTLVQLLSLCRRRPLRLASFDTNRRAFMLQAGHFGAHLESTMRFMRLVL